MYNFPREIRIAIKWHFKGFDNIWRKTRTYERKS